MSSWKKGAKGVYAAGAARAGPGWAGAESLRFSFYRETDARRQVSQG
jgi:hypothetical protein